MLVKLYAYEDYPYRSGVTVDVPDDIVAEYEAALEKWETIQDKLTAMCDAKIAELAKQREGSQALISP